MMVDIGYKTAKRKMFYCEKCNNTFGIVTIFNIHKCYCGRTLHATDNLSTKDTGNSWKQHISASVRRCGKDRNFKDDLLPGEKQ